MSAAATRHIPLEKRKKIDLLPKDSTCLDFCIQRIVDHERMIALYIRRKSVDISDNLPGLQRRQTSDYRHLGVEDLYNQIGMHIIAHEIHPVDGDALGNKDGLEKKGVRQYVFNYSEKTESEIRTMLSIIA